MPLRFTPGAPAGPVNPGLPQGGPGQIRHPAALQWLAVTESLGVDDDVSWRMSPTGRTTTQSSTAAIEGRISSLKRGYGWDRTRLNGTEGARIWTGQAVLAHNLVKIGALVA